MQCKKITIRKCNHWRLEKRKREELEILNNTMIIAKIKDSPQRGCLSKILEKIKSMNKKTDE
jgi:hypothetical protein